RTALLLHQCLLSKEVVGFLLGQKTFHYEQLVSGRSRNNRVKSSDKEYKSRSSIANSCDNLSNPSNSHVKLSNNALNSRKDCLASTSILSQEGGWFSALAENLPSHESANSF